MSENGQMKHSTTVRVAIIGSGPSGFYAAEALLKQDDIAVEVDIFERLPTPFGLVRGGVAPDHPKIKSVTRIYERIASDQRFRFFGNVSFGRDITRADLRNHYQAIIYAVGAQSDRHMGIPGENLPGSHAATEFVGWYNGHPDYRDCTFDLSQARRVAVVGNGNVAMDVVRILARTRDELYPTDIATHALEALSHSAVEEIIVLGRRGPVQAAFTNPELKELDELADADIVVAPEEIALDPLSQEHIRAGHDRTAEKNLQILTRYSHEPPAGRSRRIIMRFLVSPVEILGDDQVEAIKVVHNELYDRGDGTLRPRPTDRYETLPVDLVFRSIGYHGVPLPDVPFDATSGTIPNEKGRVIDPQGAVLTGEYAVGWIKRGPTGIIGTNKPDAVETVDALLEDIRQQQMLTPIDADRAAIGQLLEQRGIRSISFDDWKIIDQLEQQRGAAVGRPRIKFCRTEEMLEALEAEKQQSNSEALAR